MEESDLFEINVSALERDGLIEGVYESPSVLEKAPENKSDECLCKISSIAEIDFTPKNYDILDDEKGWRFAFFGYCLLIIKGGVLPLKKIS